MIYAAAALAVLLTMGLALARALLGPTLYDRILAVNMFGTKTVILIALFAFFSGRTDVLDIALIYQKPTCAVLNGLDNTPMSGRNHR